MENDAEIERLKRARAEIDSELRRHESASTPTLDSTGITPTPEVLSPPPASFTYMPPPVVLSSRYEILNEVGAGGMGIVYRARDRETGELLALKVLRPDIAADPAMGERFKSELRLARQITHKNVCRIYDFNRVGEVACISMELVEGESLRRVLARFGNLSIRAAVRIAIQICEGLHEAHRQQIVHRDMKPENVMLDAAGGVKVMDFGIAESFRTAAAEGSFAGTPAYMSPEQAMGKQADARADVYAVGMILYEMLTGARPFKGDSTLALVQAAIETPPRPPREIEPSIPQYLDNLILRCLEKDPERRFESVEELALALRAETASDAAQFDIPVPEALRRLRRPDYFLIVAAALALIVFFAAWSHVVPATDAKLTADEVTVRREAQRWAEYFSPKSAQARDFALSAEYRADWYRNLLATVSAVKPGGMLARARASGLPLFWRAKFGNADLARYAGVWDGYVLFDRDGKPVEFSRNNTTSEFLPTYKPPPSEARRQIAENLVRDFCGQGVDKVHYSETVGGDWGASYSITWQPLHPPGAAPVAGVSLRQEVSSEVRCAESWGPASELPVTFRDLFANSIGSLASLLAMVVLAVWFVRGNLYTSPLFARRAAMAVLAGLAFGWTSAVGGVFGQQQPAHTIFGLGLGTGLVCLIELVTIEHRMLRFEPGKLAAWCHFAAGRVLQPGVPAALLRGTACGILLAVLQLAIGSLAQAVSRARGWTPADLVLLGLPDPTAAALAITSGFPALFTIGAIAQNAFSVGCIGLASWYLILHARHRKYFAAGAAKSFDVRLSRAGVIATIGFLLAATAAEFHFFFGDSLGPGFAFLVTPVVLSTAVAAIFVHYDLLTSFFAVATAMLLTMNTTIVYLLSEIGNGANIALFAVWSAVVLVAAVLAFRPELAARLQGASIKIG